jgi:hypothetical protein
LETDVDALQRDVAAIDQASPSNCYTKEEADEETLRLENTIVALQQKLASVEYACHRSQQNSRKHNVEFDGVPTEVGDEPAKLEEAIIKLLAKMDVPCEPADIDAIHRLPSKTNIKGTIVRFNRRKLRDEVLRNKTKLKELRNWDIDIPGLTENSAIYVKPNLCPYYKTLAYNCRVLKKAELINGTTVDDDGTVKIKTLENYSVKILHETKLRSLFPEFRFFKFNNDHER